MTTKPVPGVSYPTQKALVAGNPRDSAIQHTNNMNAKQNALNQVAGRKNRKHRKNKKSVKKGGAVIAPQFGAKYPEQSGPGTGTNDQITKLTQIGAQSKANAAFDSHAKKGGTRTKRAGNPDWHWPCSSGGKNTRKHRKYGGNPDWHWPCSSGGKRRSRKICK
jgi:hypothetical protein